MRGSPTSATASEPGLAPIHAVDWPGDGCVSEALDVRLDVVDLEHQEGRVASLPQLDGLAPGLALEDRH